MPGGAASSGKGKVQEEEEDDRELNLLHSLTFYKVQTWCQLYFATSQ